MGHVRVAFHQEATYINIPVPRWIWILMLLSFGTRTIRLPTPFLMAASKLTAMISGKIDTGLTGTVFDPQG